TDAEALLVDSINSQYVPEPKFDFLDYNLNAKSYTSLSVALIGDSKVTNITPRNIKDGDTPHPTASMIKMFLELMIADKLSGGTLESNGSMKIDETDLSSKFINITDSDEAYFAAKEYSGQTLAPVKTGDEISYYDAMKSIMILSANNMADIMAREVFGDIESYRIYSAAWLKRNDFVTVTLGTDASGLNEGTVASANEMTIIGYKFLQVEPLKNIVSMKQLNWVYGGVHETYKNRNLGLDYGLTGIKTGTTDEAGSCLTFSFYTDVGTNRVLVVGTIMGVRGNTAVNSVDSLMRYIPKKIAGYSLDISNTKIFKYSNTCVNPGYGVVPDGTSLNVVFWKDEIAPEIKFDDAISLYNNPPDIGGIMHIGNNEYKLNYVPEEAQDKSMVDDFHCAVSFPKNK
ncbi:MAG: hypothetical protein LBN03_00005, partial [Bifidobacteriaceae bacterium]|nr:hypothetical protein [Bifidobacteriaceae bacterium]